MQNSGVEEFYTKLADQTLERNEHKTLHIGAR